MPAASALPSQSRDLAGGTPTEPWELAAATGSPAQSRDLAAGAPTQPWDLAAASASPSQSRDLAASTPTEPWEFAAASGSPAQSRELAAGAPTEPWELAAASGPPSQSRDLAAGAPTQPWDLAAASAPPSQSRELAAGTPTQPWDLPAASVSPRREPAPPAHRPQPPPPDFKPANDVEKTLISAASEGSTDTFLSTLLLAKVLLPVSPVSADGTRPGEPGFAWLTETIDGEPYVVVFTSMDRLKDHLGELIETIDVKFMQLIKAWPDPAWSFAVNPSTPVGAKLPGAQILALANWAADVGLGDAEELEPASRPTKKGAAGDPSQPTIMQKAVAPSQVDYYLERGYDRVSGFVQRANEVAHLDTPAKLYAALGLSYAGSAFRRDADEIYMLRWPAYRPSLYRIPYGGQNEPAMRAMEGWVIERAPFRGNGFAPSESGGVIAEFKVDSARLPHGAQLWRVTAGGAEKLIALLDADAPTWRKVGDE
ncbi:hypothetical protein Pflav_074820 [Phytohabitans flavus]|uniref:SseB protein N-terminal domain-containing protein n=1 Tax=Phytohabitans flavus TaxID=1076124 RepID=A0A6F8Y4N3_9ACTN|nr:hypothetical protein Pflav_074820 [Phytohabitans flavus]